MKIQVEYDERGNVLAIAIPHQVTGILPYAGLKPRPKHSVSYVEAQGVSHQNDFENIRRVKCNFRVDDGQGLPKLVPK